MSNAVSERFEWMQKGVSDFRYDDVRRLISEDAVVEQHSVTVTLPGGRVFTPPEVCVVFQFTANGRFSRVNEYAPLTRILEESTLGRAKRASDL